MAKCKLYYIIIGALILIALAASAFFLAQLADGPGRAQSNWIGKEFKVAPGESWQGLGLRLEAQKLIRSLFWYKLQLRLRQNVYRESLSLKAGSYIWPRFLSLGELIDFFQVAQPQKTASVTIPEGLRRREVAQLLQKKGIFSKKDLQQFLDETAAPKASQYVTKYGLPVPSDYLKKQNYTLEGFLFPDTYFLPPNYSAPQMVELMLQNFHKHFKKLTKNVPNWSEFSERELYAKLKLASIIQKEYRATTEAPIIASVFQNRLDQGIKLESCATIVYVLTEELGRPHPKRILFADLEHVSPYNTYLNRGLPPQPIAGVGAIALNAVFFPAQTDYLFFVVNDAVAGTHKFSSSLADHKAAREAYINNYFRR